MMQELLTDCSELDEKWKAVTQEMEIVAELTRKYIMENSMTVKNQEKYNAHYNALVEHVTVFQDGRLVFAFRDGTVIEVGAILKKWTAKSERWYNNKKGEKDMENTKYTEEFKQSIVSLYESGKSSTQICKEYGMSSSTLHKWIKKYTKVQVSETETMTMAEIKKMQKKLALLEEENIILKKAMAIFSRESGKE